MDEQGAWALVVTGAALLVVTWIWLQHKVSQVISDLATAAAGITAASGGLLVVGDATAASWVLAPLAVVAGLVLHRRVLFRGEGPFRT